MPLRRVHASWVLFEQLRRYLLSRFRQKKRTENKSTVDISTKAAPPAKQQSLQAVEPEGRFAAKKFQTFLFFSEKDFSMQCREY